MRLNILISIPQWSDFNKGIIIACTNIDAISIPQWSDFNVLRGRCISILKCIFQSHNGLILIRNIELSVNELLEFQSHNGLILI